MNVNVALPIRYFTVMSDRTIFSDSFGHVPWATYDSGNTFFDSNNYNYILVPVDLFTARTIGWITEQELIDSLPFSELTKQMVRLVEHPELLTEKA